MDSSKYIFTLDLRSVQSQITLPVTQGDTNRTLVVSFSDGTKPFILGEKSCAMMSIVRPTGTEVQEYCEMDADGSCVVYRFTEHTCIVPGLHKCQLVLYNAEGKQIAAPKFGIDAAPKLIDNSDVIIPDEDISALDAIYIAEADRRAYHTDLKARVEAGEFKGEKGDKGDKGDKGNTGEAYILTDIDKSQLIDAVLEPISDGDEVLY